MAMKGMRSIAKVALLLTLALSLVAAPVVAQEKVVMENVFFNVVWGSALGASLGVASSVLGSDDKSAPKEVRSAAFTGATAGGLIGLGLALFLVYQGITFDRSATFLSENEGAPAPPVVKLEPPPFVLISSAEHPGRVTGFSARVLDVKF